MVTKLKGWPKGMDTIQPDFAVRADALREAVNVDVLNTGALRRRKGYTARYAGHAHSLYAAGDIALFVEDGDLKRLLPDFSATTLRAGVGDLPMHYDTLNGEIVYMNNAVAGRVVNGSPAPLGVELPAAAPVVAANGGLLDAGSYQFLATFVTASGEESGSSFSALLTLGAPGGVTVTLPQPTEPEVAQVRLYMTMADGDAFYAVATQAVGDTTLVIASPPTWGRECKTQYKTRLFPGEQVAAYRGRLYVAQGSVLWHSDPLAYGLLDPARNFLLFAAPIDVLLAVEGGLYVVADKTYFLKGGGPDDFQRIEALGCGGARYSGTRFPDTNVAVWYSDRGIALGSETGAVTLVQAAMVAPDAYARGAALVREHDSVRQIVAAVRQPRDSVPLHAQDYMDAEILRAKGQA